MQKKLWSIAVVLFWAGYMVLGAGSFSWAASPGEEPEDPGNLRQAFTYEQQVTEKERSVQRRHEKRMETLFFSLYEPLWKNASMETRLEEALNKAMNEVKDQYVFENLRLVDADFQRLFLDQVVEAFAREFGPSWETFLSSLIDAFAASLERDLRTFAEELRAIRMEEARYLPGVSRLGEAFFPDLQRAGKETVNEVAPPLVPNTVDGLAVSATGLVVAVALRKVLRTRIQHYLAKRLGRAAGKKLLALAGGPWMVGVFALWTAWDVGAFVLDVSTLDSKVEEELLAAFSAAYASKCPEEMWKALAPGVREQYELAAITMKDFDRKVEALSASPAYMEMVEKLPPREQERVAGELIILERETGLPLAVLAEHLTGALIFLNESNIYDLAAMLKIMAPHKAAQWLAVGGEDTFFLWREAPVPLWEHLEPSPDSVALLRWFCDRKESEQRVLLELSREELRWVSRELSPREQSRLLRDHTASEVAEEVERLQRLPRGQQRPYGVASRALGLWDTLTALVRLFPWWLKSVLGLLVFLWVVQIFRKFVLRWKRG